MPEPFALTCGSCGEPMLPNLSQADADGCLWICINPGCPELCAGELETEDLVEGGVPKALAARLVRLIDYYEDIIEELHACAGGEEGADAGGGGAAAPPLAGSRERAQADLASLRRQVRELRRRSALAAAAADQLGLELVVSYHSDDFAEAQDAQRAPRRRGGPLRRRRPRRRRRRGVPRRHRLRAAGAARHGRGLISVLFSLASLVGFRSGSSHGHSIAVAGAATP